MITVLFALNMGSSNFAASFAAAHGGGILSERKARVLFCIFVFSGAVLMGEPVSETLNSRIIPVQLLNAESVLIVIFSATTTILLANIIHVPQSTSFVTVASISGVGIYHRQVFGSILLYLLAFWILFPLLGYIFSFLLGKIIYPPRKGNFRIYEKLVNHQDRLKNFVIAASCYNAFSVGANNVANAVGPLLGTGIFDKVTGLILISPLFGAGSFIFQKSLRTTGEKIVPLGILTATIICIVTGTLMIIASLWGVPQSFAMIKIASVTAIGGLKNGHRMTFSNPSTKKTYITWIVSPAISFCLSFLLMALSH